MSGAPGLTVVLPTLDEGGGLREILPRVQKLFERLKVSGEVVVVDGGSKDDTVAVAEAAGARAFRQKGKGFGAAVREGIAAANAPWILLMDADGSHPPETADAMWVRRESFALIVGSRYARGGSAEMPATRWVLSGALNVVSRRVLELPVHDSSSGFRLYRGDAAKAAAAASSATDFSIQQDLMVRILAAGGAVGEQAFHYAPRVAGASKANAWKLLPAYIRLLLRLKELRGGWRAEAGLFAALGVAAVTGLCGITGGLPGPERLRALPESARTSPEFAPKLADAWRALYADIARAHAEMKDDEPHLGAAHRVDIAPGWTFPPAPLLNSARSLLTQSTNPDEKKAFIILSRMRPWKLEFEPLYAQYGGAFVYPFGLFLAVARVVGLAVLTPDLAHYLATPADMARLYLLGRLFVWIFHLATVVMMYEFARLLAGRRAAVSAALLWALTPLAVVNSHILKPHPVAAFWIVAAAYFCVRAVEEDRGVDYILCGLFAGLGAGGNLSAVWALGAPVLARLVRREGGWKAPIAGSAAGAALVALTNPYLLLAPKDFAWELTIYSPSRFSLAPHYLISFLSTAPSNLGWALSALCMAGVTRGLFADPKRRALAALTVIGGLLVLGRFSNFAGTIGAMRLVYASAALAVVLAADFVASLPRPAAALVLAAALAETGLRGTVYLDNLRREAGPRSTRVAAADWIDANIPAGASVGLLRYPEPPHTPPFRWDRVGLVAFSTPEDLDGTTPPEWLVARETSWNELDPSFRSNYSVASAFPSSSPAGVAPNDDSFFANAGMLVLRRAGAR